MNNLPQIFKFDGNEVRTVIRGNEPWFVLTDVCRVLEIGNPSQVRVRLDEGVISNETLQTSGGLQQMNIINEDGLYDVILESRKPAARTFRKWITSEVIPSIRQTGSYIAKPKTQAELMLMYAEQFVEMENKMNQMQETVTTIQETFLQRDEDWRKMINGLMKGASFRTGGDYQGMRNQSYQLLEERARCDLNTRLRNMRVRLEDSGATKTRINQATRMDVIEDDPRLKEIYTTIVKELSIGTLKVVR